MWKVIGFFFERIPNQIQMVQFQYENAKLSLR